MMGKQQKGSTEKRNAELKDLLEDLLTQIQEIREEFTSTLDNPEDMIADI